LTVCRLRVGHDELRSRIRQQGSQLHLTEENVGNAGSWTSPTWPAWTWTAQGWPSRRWRRGYATPACRVGCRRDTCPRCRRRRRVHRCGPGVVAVRSARGRQVHRRIRDLPAGARRRYTRGLRQPGPDWILPPRAGRRSRSPAVQGASPRPGLGGVPPGRRPVSGHVRYMGAIPSAAWTLCRLRAGPDTLAERILLRGRGGRPAIPGDEMRGRPEAELRGRIAEASRIADTLDHASVGGLLCRHRRASGRRAR
jgi:hypothetical protein